MNFPPDIVDRVRTALDRMGYCFLSCDEIQRLLAKAPANRTARHKALEDFADLCGAEVETNEHLKSARFTPLLENAVFASSMQVQQPYPKSSWLMRPAVA